MKSRRVALWITVVVVALGVLIAIRYANTGGVSRNASQAPVAASLQAGQRAPEFQIPSNQGLFDLAKTSKPVLLEIFATWCPHCQRETTVIDRLYDEYANRVAFIAIDGSQTGMDGRSPSSEQDVLNFANTFAVRYPVAYDGSLSIANKYLQGGYPTLVVVNRKKIVTYITSGETPYAQLAAAIGQAL